MFSARLAIHRTMRLLGLHLQRWRDPYEVTAKFLQECPPQHIIDGGAYHGSATRRLLKLFPQARIHAFEPQTETFGELKRSLVDEPRVSLYPLALSDRCGMSQLHVNREAFTTSLLPTAQPLAMHPIGEQTVQTTTLDAWTTEHDIEAVGFLKLDLQGHELAALRGAEQMLRNTMVVLTEVNFQKRYQGSCLFHEVASFLYKHGLVLHSLFEVIPGGDGSWSLADALFARLGKTIPGEVSQPSSR